MEITPAKNPVQAVPTNSNLDLGPDMESLDGALGSELERLDQEFWVSRDKLKAITACFIEELNEGLEADGRNIAMNITWVTRLPTGNEIGTFLAVDLGGTDLRICKVSLMGEKRYELDQESFKISAQMKTGSAEGLWSFIADSMASFTRNHDLGDYSKEKPLPMGFTFSYPATQHGIDHGILVTWTKGFDISNVEGKDVASQLRQAMEKRDLPVKLIALANDTTGALIASAYTDPQTIIGAIFGTGCNAAYMEDCGAIRKLRATAENRASYEKNGLTESTLMAINCEYGAFDNSNRILPRTKYDRIVDADSPRPGQQTFEKMSAGLYLGEIFRLILLDLHSRDVLFRNQDIAGLRESRELDTEFLSSVENDECPGMSDTRSNFARAFSLQPSEQELIFLRRLAVIVAVRGARLTACGPAAICLKKGIKEGHVAADGSVANKHPRFKQRWSQALGEILDWSEGEQPISLTSAEDGSGVGVAVICALAMGG